MVHPSDLRRFAVTNRSYAALDFVELQECIVRCAADMFAPAMATFLPSHDKNAFDLAEAVRAFFKVMMWERTVEHVMWEASLIRAPRFDADKYACPSHPPMARDGR